MRILRYSPAGAPVGGKKWLYENYEPAIQDCIKRYGGKVPCDDVDIEDAKRRNDVTSVITLDDHKLVGYVSEVTDTDAEIELTPYGEALFKALPKCQLQFIYLIEEGDTPKSKITIQKFNINHDQVTYDQFVKLEEAKKKILEEG